MRAGRLIIAFAALLALGVGGVVFWRLIEQPAGLSGAVAMTTLAGDGERGFVDGPGATARFSDPFALAIDGKGALYVADAGDTNRIRKIEPDGRVSTLPGDFVTPSGVAVDRAGNVYVAETGANRIRRIGNDGVVTTLAGDGTAGFQDGPAAQSRFNGPIGVAVDKAGNVYVADSYNDRVRLVTADGQVRTLAGGAAPGFADGSGAGAAFDTPCGLALDRDGALLIADTGNDAVRRLGKDGMVTTLARGAEEGVGSALQEPVGLALRRDGHLYIATLDRGQILERSPKGDLRIVTGRNAQVEGNRTLVMARTAGIALDGKGALYVAEAGRFAVRKLNRLRGRPAPAPPRVTSPALLRAESVPWPLGPQSEWHELVGGVGEVRGGRNGENRDHLHAGLDVRADVGQTVLAVADETVFSPVTAFNPNGRSEGLDIDQLTYIHMRVGRTPAGEPLDPSRFLFVLDGAGKLTSVRIKRGTRFHVGDPLGTVNGMAHVHLELGPRGFQANPIGLHFPGLTDSFIPRILGVQLRDAAGRRLTERQDGRLLVTRSAGPLSIVVDAFDQVDGNEARRRLGLYRVGYQILKADGTAVTGFEQPLVTIEFDRLPPGREATKIAYAPESGETVHGASETRFLYVVTNTVRGGVAKAGGWNPATLSSGDYIVRILAADYAGNQAFEGRDLPITVR